MFYNQITRNKLADAVMGIRVNRAAALLDATQTLFNVEGGRVALLYLLGEVTVGVTNATTIKLNFDPDTSYGTTDTELSSTGASLAGAAIGLKLTLPAAAGSNITQSTGEGAALLSSAPIWVLAPGYLEAVIGTPDTTGYVKWTMWYVPIDDGAYVTAG
jgi:hypothetical protein